MDAAGSSPLHIVIFPWLAMGHLLPCLELAGRLAARGHRVSFVSVPRNLARLPPVRPALAHLVDLVALPLPRVAGLPDGAESTGDIPFDKVNLHREAFDVLAAPFAAFLDAACADDGRKPDWVVADFVHHWVAAAAQDRQVPCVMFLPCAAGFAAMAGAPPESRAEERQAIARSMEAAPRFEAELAAETFAAEDDTLGPSPSIISRYFMTLKMSKLFAVRSCPELEPDALPLLAGLYGKPVVPLGLLLPTPEGAAKKNTEDDAMIMRWLDAQPAKSVVYVALGSEAPVRAELLRELAHGLELAGTRFLWALRTPVGVHGGDNIVPDGFGERTGERGLVVARWVPQTSVLAHGALGAFLTHCGWGSVVEGLQFGHPLIMLPIAGDQGPNAQLMEERKVGVLVPRDEEDGSFSRDDVAGAVRAVVVEEDGSKVFAASVKKLQEIVANRECHERYIDGFIQQLRSLS